MNESENKGTAAEAILVLIFFFIVLIIFLFRFGKSESNVINNQISEEKINERAQSEAIAIDNAQNEIYNKYVKQVYDAQKINIGLSEDNSEIDKIISSYQSELESSVLIPTQNIALKNVSTKADVKNYAANFETLFQNLKNAGGTSEGIILQSQIDVDGQLLPLSKTDKDTLLNIAKEYDLFVDNLILLSTPKIHEKKILELAIASKNISYILKQMANQNDKNIYTLWISKYAENMSAIITIRYGIQ